MVKQNRKSRAKPSTRQAEETTRRRRVMVMIHGAGPFSPDWYKPLVTAIQKELGHPFDYLPVYYADVATRRAALADSPSKAKFKAAFQKELQRSFQATMSTMPAHRKGRAVAARSPIQMYAVTTQHVADYFFSPATRAAIQARLIEKLDEARKKFDEIVLVAHSLGTVVSFDVLKQYAARYNIVAFFTAGSPIAKLRRIGKYDDRLGAIDYQHVRRWYNVYDTTDWVADPLGTSFPKPGYRVFDVFVDIGVLPDASHDYLNNRETIQLFADAMR